MSSRHAQQAGAAQPFLTAPVGRLFVSNALPMAIVLSLGGLLNAVDGVFVGRFVGPDALAAVSALFPLVMLTTALSALVGGGLSSRMARHLGAGQHAAAFDDLRAARALALVIGFGLMALFLTCGRPLAAALTGGSTRVAQLSHDYLRVIALAAPLQLLLGVYADASRTEGRAALVARLSVVMNLVNIAANAVLIAGCGLGVAGSALGTLLAQAVGLVLLVAARRRAVRGLPTPPRPGAIPAQAWRSILLLGVPVSLGLLGTVVVSATVILALRTAPDRETTLAAYGIVTRLMGLAFLVQMAMALAVQTIVGHHLGAGLPQRAAACVRLGMVAAAAWCLCVVVVLLAGGAELGWWFTPSREVAHDVARILHAQLLFYVCSGPLLVLALSVQAAGRAREAALLTLLKPWVLTPGLVLICVASWGSRALWWAFPLADAMLLCAVVVVWRLRRGRGPVGDATGEGTP